MKTIIAGSRTITDPSVLLEALAGVDWPITEVVSGMAEGVDRLGESWAEKSCVPVVRFPPDWIAYGRRAGFVRNGEMAGYADALLAVWDGRSKGTAHMIAVARGRGLRVFVRVVD